MREKLASMWDRLQGPISIAGATAAVLVWAYSNFATANEMDAAKKELRDYVDDKHAEVKGELVDIRASQVREEQLMNTILLEVRRR